MSDLDGKTSDISPDSDLFGKPARAARVCSRRCAVGRTRSLHSRSRSGEAAWPSRGAQ